MDLYGLIRYLNGNSSAKESAEVERWMKNDTDGSRLALYKDARAIYEATLMQPRPAAAPVRNGISNWRRIANWSMGIAAAFALVLLSIHTGRTGLQRELQSLSESINVPAGRTMEITMEDGTRVWLNSGTEISYPKVFGPKRRSLTLISGEVMMDVTKDEKRPFIVETAAADIKVYGTRFDVVSDEDGQGFCATLYRGSIGITPKFENAGEIILKSGQTLTLASDGSFRTGIIPEDDATTDWTAGLVNIAGSDFQALMEKLEKAFGTTIVIRCKTIPEYNISRGRVRVVDGVDHALDVIGLAADFKYQHDYNTDTIIIL